MEHIYTIIGEHCIQVQSQSKKIIDWIRRNFTIIPASPSTPHLRVRLHEGYGVPFVNYEVSIKQEENNQIVYRRSDYLIVVDSDYREASISVHNELALKHAFMNLYSSFLVHTQWGLLIHSSCVIEKDKAYLFAGHSGAGKSTAAKLSDPRELLSDEATIVKITPDTITVFDSPFRSELSRSGSMEKSSLAGIYLLNQASSNHMVTLSKSDGFLQLVNKVFYWSHSLEETVNILHLLLDLAKAVTICELHFQKNDTFWELIS